MELKDFFLEQLEMAAAASRKALERVPEGHDHWKPHEKSMQLGYLAALVADMPGWVTFMLDRDQLNLDDPSSEALRTKTAARTGELPGRLDANLAAARAALEATTEERLHGNWGFAMGGKLLVGGPRYTMLSNALFSHLAHHRGQLTVYLRLLNAKVRHCMGRQRMRGCNAAECRRQHSMMLRASPAREVSL